MAESPDGFLRYLDESGAGLANQGWKDSGDSMRDAVGAIAEGPIALVETQAYAVEAAYGAADLLEAVMGVSGDPWREWADALADRVRARFWVRGDGAGPALLSMALDGAGRQVDGVGSNMGHVLGTGTADGGRGGPGARAGSSSPTCSDRSGSAPSRAPTRPTTRSGYHTGSVWTHDTAIGAWGLARTGHGGGGRGARALVEVAAASGYRWPELYSAEPVLGRPAPYPASCRPQAWAAASAGLWSVPLGLRADLPRAGSTSTRSSRRPSAPWRSTACGWAVSPSASRSTPRWRRRCDRSRRHRRRHRLTAPPLGTDSP